MSRTSVEEIVISILITITGFIFFILFIVSVRRIKRSRYYKRLDLVRERYEAILIPTIKNGLSIPDECYGKKRSSPEWKAIEEILFEAVKRKVVPVASITGIFDKLGYIDFYLERLQSGNRFQRSLAAERLGRLRAERGTEDIIKAIKDPHREVRIVAVRAIGEISSPEGLRPLIDTLISGIGEPGSIPIRIVKTAIVKYKKGAIQYLLPLLHHTAWRVRAQASDIIGEIGVMEPVEALISKLNDPEPDVRAKVARALGKIKAREAVQPLIERLKDASWVVRLQSVKALGFIREGEAIYPLLDLLRDSNWQVRSAAGNSLLKIGDLVIPSLLRMLIQTKDRYTREQIVEELQKTDILEKQINRLDSKNTKEREEASILLVAAGNSGALGFIIRTVKSHADPVIKMRLVHILSLIDHPDVTGILQEVADSDENEPVRYAAKKVLERR